MIRPKDYVLKKHRKEKENLGEEKKEDNDTQKNKTEATMIDLLDFDFSSAANPEPKPANLPKEAKTNENNERTPAETKQAPKEVDLLSLDLPVNSAEKGKSLQSINSPVQMNLTPIQMQMSGNVPMIPTVGQFDPSRVQVIGTGAMISNQKVDFHFSFDDIQKGVKNEETKEKEDPFGDIEEMAKSSLKTQKKPVDDEDDDLFE